MEGGVAEFICPSSWSCVEELESNYVLIELTNFTCRMQYSCLQVGYSLLYMDEGEDLYYMDCQLVKSVSW